MVLLRSGALALLALGGGASASAYPPRQEGVKVVQSKNFPGVSISYKETTICETSPGVKGFSGHVHLPRAPAEGRDYEVHTYFWFFQARADAASAPLSIWLQGGPGVPSITAALGENGPCAVGRDSRSTTPNRWSWNDRVNMLYIDQPVQAGFSYDTLRNGTVNEVASPFLVTPDNSGSGGGIPQTNDTFFVGTFASQDGTQTANTTEHATRALWAVVQAWMQDFPEFRSTNNRLSVWGESYAGHWVPSLADYLEKQSDLVRAGEPGSFPPGAVELRLDSVGLANACVDPETQMPSWPEFAVNNTYGVQAISAEAHAAAASAVPECLAKTRTCRALAASSDPDGLGSSKQVNDVCADAYKFCMESLTTPYLRNPSVHRFDIRAPALHDFPPKWAAGFLNSADTQRALGVAQNITGLSWPVQAGFDRNGDFMRGHGLEVLGGLLDRGVKVAMFYGDADFICNWLGGESLSLAINSTKVSSQFRAAGYADLRTNGSYVGGAVRQAGGLSFARIFDSGHESPWYQPETAYQLFNRVMFNKDVATGESDSTPSYSTTGPSSVFDRKNTLPAHQEPPTCYVWDILETCTPEQTRILANGSAITRDFILVGHRNADGTEVIYDAGDVDGNDGNDGGEPHKCRP